MTFRFRRSCGLARCAARTNGFAELALASKLPFSLEGFTQDGYSLSRVSVEELECLATWKEGSSRYLVGRLHHGHASSNEDRYRCFVYEKAGQTVQSNLNRAAMGMGTIEHEVALPGGPVPEGTAEVYRVAQSGDATCNGLFSPMEGSRTMTLRKGESRCRIDARIFIRQEMSRLLDPKINTPVH